MTINTNDILQVAQRILMPNSEVALNVFIARYLGVTSLADSVAITAMTNWIESIYTPILPQLESTGTFDTGAVDVVSGLGVVLRSLGVISPTLVPTNVGELFPHGVAPMIRVLTITPRVWGRKFLPLYTEATAIEGFLGAAEIVNLVLAGVAWADPFDDPVAGDTWVPGVISAKQLDFEPFSGTVIVGNVPGYQRRRKPGVGI